MKPLFTRFSVILLLLLFSACGDSNSSRGVRIGVLNSLSGELASYGPGIDAGLRLAEQEVNERLAASGSGVALSLEYADTGTSPAAALSKLQEFANDGIKIVIGPMSSAELEAVRDFSTANDIVLISPASTVVSLERSDDLILRTVASDRGQAAAIATAIRYFGTRFYCPIWRADSFGDDLTLMVGREFESRGGRFAPGSRYPAGTTDFTDALEQLEIQLDAYVDFFGRSSSSVYAVAFDEIYSILQQANSSTLLKSIRWYGSDGIALNPKVFADQAILDFMKESQMISPIFAGDRNAPDFERVRSEIERDLDSDTVDPYSLLAYDAALLVGEALRALGTSEVSGAVLRNKIIEVSKQTVGASGNLELDQNGDRRPGTYEFWQIAQDANGKDSWQLAGLFDAPGGNYARGIFSPVD